MTLDEFKNIYFWEYVHRMWGRAILDVYLSVYTRCYDVVCRSNMAAPGAGSVHYVIGTVRRVRCYDVMRGGSPFWGFPGSRLVCYVIVRCARAGEAPRRAVLVFTFLYKSGKMGFIIIILFF